MADARKVIQLIPAQGWFIRYREEDGSITRSPAVCIALFNDGDMQFMDTDSGGFIDTCVDVSNFVSVEHEDYDPLGEKRIFAK